MSDVEQAAEMAQLRADLESALRQASQVRRASWVAVLCALAGVALGYWVLSRQSTLPRIIVSVVRVPRHVPADWTADEATSADSLPDEEEHRYE